MSSELTPGTRALGLDAGPRPGTGKVDGRDKTVRYPTNLSDPQSSGLIYSTDQLAYSKEFVAMLQDRKVSLVDMESGAIAAVCERNNSPFT